MATTMESRPEKKIEQNPFDLDGWNFLLRDNQVVSRAQFITCHMYSYLILSRLFFLSEEADRCSKAILRTALDTISQCWSVLESLYRSRGNW